MKDGILIVNFVDYTPEGVPFSNHHSFRFDLEGKLADFIKYLQASPQILDISADHAFDFDPNDIRE